MITMTDFIHGSKSNNQWQADYYRRNSNQNAQSPIQTQSAKPDTFDKKDKEEKLIFSCLGAGQLAKAGAIIGGVVATGIAIAKRKKIGKFVSDLFNGRSKISDVPKPPKNVVPPKTTKPKVPNIELPKPPVTKLSMTVDNLKKEILSANEEDISKLVERVKRGTKDEQKNLLEVYEYVKKQHFEKIANPQQEIPEAKNFLVLKKQMEKQNISFIPKLEINPGDSEKVIVDKINEITSTMGFNKNEATLMEGLDWLEKYGQYGKDIDYSKHFSMTDTMLDLITVQIRIDYDNPVVTDKVLNRYIDIYNKFAKKWESNGYIYSDAPNLSVLFEEYAGKMSKETAYRFLDSMEKTAGIKGDAYTLKLYAEDLKIDEKSKEEFLRRAEALCDKLPKYKKISANK